MDPKKLYCGDNTHTSNGIIFMIQITCYTKFQIMGTVYNYTPAYYIKKKN